MKILLHACFGPCLLLPYEVLSRQHDVEVFFFNPNIHPAEEYHRRRTALLEFTKARDIVVHEEAYDPQVWQASVFTVSGDSEERCGECYRLRMTATARFASALGFDGIASTLAISPYQRQEMIREAGMMAADETGLIYLDEDFRELFPEATRRSRELGMYRQNYCGCLASAKVAEESRTRKRETRRR